MKKQVLLDHPSIQLNEDGEIFYDDIVVAFLDEENDTVEMVPEGMLAVLLKEDVLIVNSFWWKNEWENEEDRKLIYLGVNCSDFFGPAADAEELHYNDIQCLFFHFLKDPVWGTRMWTAKKRDLLPFHPRVIADIRMSGLWNEELDLLEAK